MNHQELLSGGTIGGFTINSDTLPHKGSDIKLWGSIEVGSLSDPKPQPKQLIRFIRLKW